MLGRIGECTYYRTKMPHLPTLECKRILDVLHLPEEQLVAVYNASINTTW